MKKERRIEPIYFRVEDRSITPDLYKKGFLVDVEDVVLYDLTKFEKSNGFYLLNESGLCLEIDKSDIAIYNALNNKRYLFINIKNINTMPIDGYTLYFNVEIECDVTIISAKDWKLEDNSIKI